MNLTTPKPGLIDRLLPDPSSLWKPSPWSTLDFKAGAALGILFFLLYVLTMSCAPDEWDSAQFCMALDTFNVKMHQPHPPGYPLYVGAGWLVRALTGLPNHTSLTLVSAFGGGLTLASLYFISRQILNRNWAALGVLAAGFSPMLWLNSIKALSDASASGMFLLTASLALAACLQKRPRLLLLAALAAALASGFRPQNSFVLVLMLAASAGIGGLGWRSAATAIGLWALACLLWLLPTMAIQASAQGGDFWTSYWIGNRNQFMWRFNQPTIYAGAALATDPYLLQRFYTHFSNWLGLGLGYYAGHTFWFSLPLILGGWAGFLRILLINKPAGLGRITVFFLSWMIPYILMIFLFLPSDSRYYIPILAPLAVLAVAGWSGWFFLPDSAVRSLALLIPVILFLTSAGPAWQSHVEPSPPIRGMEWLTSRIEPGQRPGTLVILDSSIRHYHYYQPGFRIRSLNSMKNTGALTSALEHIDQVYTDSSRLTELEGCRHLTLEEVAVFERPDLIHQKHRKIVLYRVLGWQLDPPPK